MFFTTLGRTLAKLAFAAGILRLVMGTVVAFSEDPARLAVRYFGSKTSGEAIDQGLLIILGAVALGILTDISRNASKRSA